MKKLLNIINKIFKKLFPFKIYIMGDWSSGNTWTKYKEIHKTFHINDIKLMTDVVKHYGKDCQNVVKW